MYNGALRDKTNVLVVDDDIDSAECIATLLTTDQFQATTATSAKQAIELMRHRHFPVVVADITLGGPDGLTLIPVVKQQDPPSLVIFVTGHASLDTAVSALREGAFDYLCKTDDLHGGLLRVVENAVKHLEALNPNANSIVRTSDSERQSMAGESPAMAKIYRMIAKAAVSNGHVLITGESGTGKELVAHAIHDHGPWSGKPFVTVNCGALTETLLESELFGHVKGAFTGATGNKTGLFEAANGGVIFLDEIGDVSLALQVKLLRAVQEGEIKPVGSVETRKVTIRVIAATHRNLETLIKEGAFREDLYYRLKVFLIDVPPLRDRKQDIRDIVRCLMGRLARQTTRPMEFISEEAMQLLEAYPWPGNVRELENAIKRAIGMASGATLFPDDFPPEVLEFRPDRGPLPVAMENDMQSISLEQIEAAHIAETLRRFHFNKTKTAAILGIDRGTLYRKAVQYRISLLPPPKHKPTHG